MRYAFVMTTLDGAAERPRALRADAERNRAKILAQAAELFGERGLGASLEDIARRSSVGIGTLYRRFPSREVLIEAVYLDSLEHYASIAGAAAEHARQDPWEAFRAFMMFSLAQQAENRGFSDVLLAGEAQEPAARDAIARAEASTAVLFDRAIAASVIRPDANAGDLRLTLLAGSGLASGPAERLPGAWERLAALVLDGLRYRGATALPAAVLRRAL